MRIAINARFLIRNQLEGIGWYSAEVLRRIVQLMPEQIIPENQVAVIKKEPEKKKEEK